MSGSIWATLGIRSTNDLDAIRRAYALKLRSTNPEDDPQGFMALRAAYEAALRRTDHGRPAPPGAAAHRPAKPIAVVDTPGAPPDADSDSESPALEIDPAPGTDIEQEDLQGRWDALAASLENAWGADPALLERLLAAPALDRMAVRAELEMHLADLIAGNVPKSDALVIPAIAAFGWGERSPSQRMNPAVGAVLRREAQTPQTIGAMRPVRGAGGYDSGPNKGNLPIGQLLVFLFVAFFGILRLISTPADDLKIQPDVIVAPSDNSNPDFESGPVPTAAIVVPSDNDRAPLPPDPVPPSTPPAPVSNVAGVPAGPAVPIHPDAWLTQRDRVSGLDKDRGEVPVEMILEIDPTGHVRVCEPDAGNIPTLGAITCRLIQARARFLPASDAGGNSVVYSYRQTVVWHPYPGPPQGFVPRVIVPVAAAAPVDVEPSRRGRECPVDHLPAPGAARPPVACTPIAGWLMTADFPEAKLFAAGSRSLTARYDIERDGFISNCRLDPPSGVKAVDSAVCAMLARRVHYLPGRDQRGHTTRWNYGYSWGWSIKSGQTLTVSPAMPKTELAVPSGIDPLQSRADDCHPAPRSAQGGGADGWQVRDDRKPGCY